jgi:hypothetical protein
MVHDSRGRQDGGADPQATRVNGRRPGKGPRAKHAVPGRNDKPRGRARPCTTTARRGVKKPPIRKMERFLSDAEQGQDALLLHAFGRHELDIWPRGRFADRGGIGSIVLLSLLNKGLHHLRRNQLHAVPKAGQHAGPVMGAAAGFHDHRTSRLLLKECDQIVPSQLPSPLRDP